MLNMERDADEVRDWLEGIDLQTALADAAQSLAQDVEARIKAVMPVRSGRLRQSVGIAVDSGPSSVAVVLSADTPYAALVEWGFEGVESIAAHLRRVSVCYGRPLVTPVEAMVRAHARRVDLPGHHVFTDTLAAMEPRIRTTFADTIDTELSS